MSRMNRTNRTNRTNRVKPPVEVSLLRRTLTLVIGATELALYLGLVWRAPLQAQVADHVLIGGAPLACVVLVGMFLAPMPAAQRRQSRCGPPVTPQRVTWQHLNQALGGQTSVRAAWMTELIAGAAHAWLAVWALWSMSPQAALDVVAGASAFWGALACYRVTRALSAAKNGASALVPRRTRDGQPLRCNFGCRVFKHRWREAFRVGRPDLDDVGYECERCGDEVRGAEGLFSPPQRPRWWGGGDA